MSREYVFEFSGTKEDFLKVLNRFPKHDCFGDDYYYIDDYIVKLTDNEIHFGVERGGHSGGYWFVPIITEFDDRIELCGTIQYISPDSNSGRIKKILDDISELLFIILFLPIVLILKLYTFIEWMIRKIRNRPKPKEKTTEGRLFNLMEVYFGYVKK